MVVLQAPLRTRLFRFAACVACAAAVAALTGCTAANRQIQFSKPPPAVSEAGFISPLYGTVSSTYGNRVLRGKAGVHKGIDVAGKLLVTPVFAVKEGLVTVATRSKTYGLWIEITHPQGWKTRYGHLSWMHVRKGQRVIRGDLIGRIGNTGRSYGAHLHFEVLRDDRQVDPLAHVPIPKPKPKPPAKVKPKAPLKEPVPAKPKEPAKAPPGKAVPPAKPKTPEKPPGKAPAAGKPVSQLAPGDEPPL